MSPALLCFGAFALFPQETTLAAGSKLPPYSFLLSIGEQRGRSHCYVCESQEKPVVILFVSVGSSGGKSAFPSTKTTQTAQILDEALTKREHLAAWLTLLHPKQEELDGRIVKWAAEAGLRNLPVGVFEDPLGPPAYRLNPNAAMTAIIAKDGKVEKALVYRENDPIADFQKAIGAELDRMAPIKTKPVAETKPSGDAKAGAETKPTGEAKPKTEVQPPAESKPAGESKPKVEGKPVAEKEQPKAAPKKKK